MKRRLALLLAASLPVTGCLASPPAPAFEVTLRLSPTPALIGATRLIIDVADPGGNPVTDATVSVEGVPEEGDARTATIAIAEEQGTGRYVVPGYDLDVGGPWTVAVTVTDSTGISTTRAFAIVVYGGS